MATDARIAIRVRRLPNMSSPCSRIVGGEITPGLSERFGAGDCPGQRPLVWEVLTRPSKSVATLSAMIGRWIRRCGLVGVLTLILSCGFASSALAWRPPTRSEHRAITRAAKETPTAYPGKTVHVGAIRVSTVGPWASARIAIYINGKPDGAIDILHRVRGKWVNVGAGSSEEQCVMPYPDRQNLGFDERCPK